MFSDPNQYLWLILFLPLLGSVVSAVAGPGGLGRHSHWPCVLGAVGACVLSLLVILDVASSGRKAAVVEYTWFRIGEPPPALPPGVEAVDLTGHSRPLELDVGIRLRADGLAAVMLVAVTFIGALIAIYSIGYMHHDPGYPRFFAEISLFLFSMTGLVLADNFLLLYAFWEGVGLCSYLLIGFWFARPAAAAAARKAFLVTRLGDIGLFVGIVLLWLNCASVNYSDVFAWARDQSNDPWLVAICLLLFAGAAGKSAQFPLHVWLPDAMEGPSPVSALIHAATMVTAGVYLLARCQPLFVYAPPAQVTVACIGGFTALLAALIALTQTDLKRVLAYSTISQLGYMFLALGSGLTKELAAAAVVAAIFHLLTHAFFKALLFLGAGSVMHALGDVSDMRKFGGLRQLLPVTHWTFLCGAAALAGFPFLFSGFWSKDEILGAVVAASHHESLGWIYSLLFLLALVTAGLTAFYTSRAYFKTFWGQERLPAEAGQHAHESPPVMLWPLRILAVGAIVVGPVLALSHFLGNFLEQNFLPPGINWHQHTNWPLMLGSSAFALGGIGLAWLFYVRKPTLPDALARSAAVLYALSRNKFYLDEIYELLLVLPLAGLAKVCRLLDMGLVDKLVDLLAQVPRGLGYLVRPLQNGLVQFYALLMVLGLAGLLLRVVFK